MVFLKGMVIWLTFILAESLNGMLRMIWLIPALGAARAEQLSFVTGSVLLLTIATFFVRWLQASRVQLLGVGLLWMVLTLVFEVTLGRLIFGYSWQQIAAHFNLFNGELMPVELVLLACAPFIATTVRNALTSTRREIPRSIA